MGPLAPNFADASILAITRNPDAENIAGDRRATTVAHWDTVKTVLV